MFRRCTAVRRRVVLVSFAPSPDRHLDLYCVCVCLCFSAVGRALFTRSRATVSVSGILEKYCARVRVKQNNIWRVCL